MPQSDALQISKRKMCGEQEHVCPSPLKHRLLCICQVVRFTFSLCTHQSYSHLRQKRSVKLGRESESCHHSVSTINVMQQKLWTLDLRGGGCSMSMPGIDIQYVTVLSQGVVILK